MYVDDHSRTRLVRPPSRTTPLPMTHTTAHLDVDCFVRAPTTCEAVDDVIDRLRAHERAGDIASLTVHTWPATVSLDDPADEALLDVYERFRDWAEARDATLEPAFRVERRVSQYTGTDERRLHLPMICLAAYEDDELYCVVPNRSADRTCTVSTALDAVESEDPESVTALREATPPTPVTES